MNQFTYDNDPLRFLLVNHKIFNFIIVKQMIRLRTFSRTFKTPIKPLLFSHI